MTTTQTVTPSLDRATFLRGLGKLLANYRSSLPADGGDALMAAWWESISVKSWVSQQVFDLAVGQTLVEVERFMPTIAEFLLMCQDAQRQLHTIRHQHEEALRPALVDESASTPEERKRWAKENVEIQQYANRWEPTAPEVLARLSAADRAAAEDFDARCASVIAWPSLSPAARRAKERRIEAEKVRAVAVVTVEARRAMRDRLDAIAAERAATVHPRQQGGKHTVKVHWNDGVESLVEFFEEDTARMTQKWLNAHPPLSKPAARID